ncbi:EcsC family protein [Lutibacter sp. B2]|nr:EcsC family protein [Lutibacter sp. B2]
MNQEMMMTVLDKAYEAAVNGLPGISSAIELGDEYLVNNNYNKVKAVDSLINWQIAKCGTSGFLSGLGGLITLPVAIPANITSVIYVQIRMIAAIAHISGQDIKDDKVKSLVYMCLCGNAAKDIAKIAGIQLGKKLTANMIKKISGATLTKINQKVGFKLITKFGEKGIVNLGKMIPLVGGIVGAGFDVASTSIIANVAKTTFITD